MDAVNESIAAAKAEAGEVALSSGAGQYLSFLLGDENYAINVTDVEVVVEWCRVTRVPKAPEHMRGVINHRGSVVPVVDLRRRLGLGAGREGEGASIIVMDVAYEGDRVQVGVLADSVEEVVELDPSSVERAPDLGSRRGARYVKGMVRRGEGFTLLLDMDKVFVPEEGERAAE